MNLRGPRRDQDRAERRQGPSGQATGQADTAPRDTHGLILRSRGGGFRGRAKQLIIKALGG